MELQSPGRGYSPLQGCCKLNSQSGVRTPLADDNPLRGLLFIFWSNVFWHDIQASMNLANLQTRQQVKIQSKNQKKTVPGHDRPRDTSPRQRDLEATRRSAGTKERHGMFLKVPRDVTATPRDPDAGVAPRSSPHGRTGDGLPLFPCSAAAPRTCSCSRILAPSASGQSTGCPRCCQGCT